MAGSRVAQPPPCCGFLLGFAGGISELRRARSASAGRKLMAWVTSVFLHKQLAANKHLNPRLCKSIDPPRSSNGGGGKRGEGKCEAPNASAGWGVCKEVPQHPEFRGT